MGEVFAGRYELIDPIASGGMGTVWRVVDHADGEVKAAKMLRQADAAMLLRFVREQSMRIDHTHVVTPQSWAGVDDRVLFTMPLVRGGSVSTLMRKYGALPPRWVGPLVEQTLQALEAVHSAGIVHRDIKPGNLLLEPTGAGRPHLRLTDFGIAVPSDEPRLTNFSALIGTPGYMPPEQYHGADPHPSADIYALGMVTLEMLTGTRPPREPEPVPLETLRTGDPARDPVVDVIGAATSYDAAARPSATDLRAHPALRRLLELPTDPADGIVVGDEFPPLPAGHAAGPDRDTMPSQPPTIAPGPPPSQAPTRAPVAPGVAGSGGTAVLPPPPPPRTREETMSPVLPAAPRSGVLAPVLVIVLGVLGLIAAAWLLLG